MRNPIPYRYRNLVYSFIIAIVIAVTAFYSQDGLLKTANIIGWFAFSFFLYKNVFVKVNAIDMASDLNLIVFRIVGGIIAFVGLYFGLYTLFFAIIGNMDPLTVGVSIIVSGFGALGLFMGFRTKRRYAHLYVNR
jgi:hypothetical protein